MRAAASFFASADADADFFLCFFFSEQESSTSLMMGECVSVIGFRGLLGFKMEVARVKIYVLEK